MFRFFQRKRTKWPKFSIGFFERLFFTNDGRGLKSFAILRKCGFKITLIFALGHPNSLTSSGIEPNLQRDMIRFSTGRETTDLQIDDALNHLEKVL